MKKLDFYILRKFLGTFFYAIGLIIMIVIIFDLSEKIDDFIEKQAPLNEIFLVYYVNFIPYFINLFSPLFTFIAVIFFTSRLAFHSEIIAMLGAGISFRRLLLPYLIGAVLLALLSGYLSNFLIPPANEKRLEFEYQYVRSPQGFRERNVHMQVRPGVFIYMENFNERTGVANRFAIEHLENGRLVYKLMANQATWQPESESWLMEMYNVRTLEHMNEKLVFGEKLDTILPFTPHDFIQDLRDIETMNYRELRDFIANERLKGSEHVKFFEVEKHRRMSFPFATLVLTLIGVSLSCRKLRGGTGLHLGLGIGLSFAYILFMQISTTFATNGNLHPFLAVWIPNILFGLAGVFLLRLAPK